MFAASAGSACNRKCGASTSTIRAPGLTCKTIADAADGTTRSCEARRNKTGTPSAARLAETSTEITALCLTRIASTETCAGEQHQGHDVIAPAIYVGICINSDTSSEPPTSRKGQALATNSASSIESALITVKPDMDVVPPVVTVPSGFTVLVCLSGLAGLTAESPNDDNHSLYFAKCCLPSSGLDG